MAEVLPCMSTGAATMRPPKAWPMHCMAQTDPEDRDLAGQLVTTARLTPLFSGRPGPGEMMMPSGASARMPAMSMASLRNTTGSAPSSPNSWTRL
jgi:hypothetical protein